MDFKKLASGLLASAVLVSGGLLLQPASAFASTALCAVDSDFADEEWISDFVIDGVTVSGTQGDTYADVSGSSLVTLQAGQTYNIDITVSVDFSNMVDNISFFDGDNDGWDENVFAWLDLNQDGTVDLQAEELFSDGDNTTNFTQVGSTNVWTETFSGSFTVPANAYNGVSVGRVMNQYVAPGDEPVLCNSDPLAFDPGVSAFEYGSTTDYAVTIQGGVDNPQNSSAPSSSASPSLAETGSDSGNLVGLSSLFILAGVAVLAFVSRMKRKQ